MSVRKLAGQTAIYGISSIAGRAINWGLTPLYTHYFLPEEYGIYSDLIAMVFYALVLLTFGMETAFFHFVNKDERPQKVYNTAFTLVSILSLSFLALALALRQPIASILGYGLAPNLVLMAIAIVVLDALAALPMARLRHQQKAKRFAFISLVNIGVSVTLNIVLIVFVRADIEFIFLSNVIASGAKLLLALIGNMPTQIEIPQPLFKQVSCYGFFIMLTGLLGALNELLDRNLIPRLWPEGGLWEGKSRSGIEMNGIYSANYKLAVLVTLATQAYRYAAEPFFFRDAKNKKSKENMAKVFYYYILFSLLALLGVGCFAWEIINFDAFGLLGAKLLNTQYHSGVIVVPILLLANVCLGAYINLSMWFKITGQLKVGLYIALFGAAVTIAINLLLIPTLGFVASAIATLLCYGSMAAMCYQIGQKFYPVPYQIGKLLAYGFIAFGVAIAGLWLSRHGYTGPMWVGLKAVVCFGLVAAVVLYERRQQTSPR